MAGGDGGAGAGLGWRWDVALSFAGAQRDYVEQVAAALKERGLRCFYDADEQVGLWGKYLAEELPAIYGEQAAAVVVFISAEYVGAGLDAAGAAGGAFAGRCGSGGSTCCRLGSMIRRCRGCCRTWSPSTCAAVRRGSSRRWSRRSWPGWTSRPRRRSGAGSAGAGRDLVLAVTGDRCGCPAAGWTRPPVMAGCGRAGGGGERGPPGAGPGRAGGPGPGGGPGGGGELPLGRAGRLLAESFLPVPVAAALETVLAGAERAHQLVRVGLEMPP